jgi:predicted nucleic acid-binding protein
VIFVDSNIPMYLVGAEHPNKAGARRLLERAIADGEILVTDAEVLQEILHRYAAIGRRDAIGPASQALLDVVDEVFPVERADVDRARRLVVDGGMSARDAVHVAIMHRRGVDRVMTFDLAFDSVEGIERMKEYGT